MKSSKSKLSLTPPPAKNTARFQPSDLRGCEAVQIQGVDLPYLWAAYRRGVFDDVFPPSLTTAQFRAAIEDVVAGLLDSGGDVFILKAKTGRGVIPVGLVDMVIHCGQGWPHVRWFPEASLRNRLECAMRFLSTGKLNMVVAALPEDVALFDHLCKYGVLRRIGVGIKWHQGLDATLFETARP